MSLRQLWRLWSVLLVVEILLAFTLQGSFKAGSAARPSVEPLPKVPAVTELPALAPKAAVIAAQTELAATELWGKAAKETTIGRKTDDKPLAWSLSGVFMVGKDLRQVIMLFKDHTTPPRQLEEGDTLPNGDTIKEIKRDKVLIQAKDSEHRYWVQINRTGDSKK